MRGATVFMWGSVLRVGVRLDRLRLCDRLDSDLLRSLNGLGHVLHPYPQQTSLGVGLDVLGRDALGKLERPAERAVAHLAHEHLAPAVLPAVLALAADREATV